MNADSNDPSDTASPAASPPASPPASQQENAAIGETTQIVSRDVEATQVVSRPQVTARAQTIPGNWAIPAEISASIPPQKANSGSAFFWGGLAVLALVVSAVLVGLGINPLAALNGAKQPPPPPQVLVARPLPERKPAPPTVVPPTVVPPTVVPPTVAPPAVAPPATAPKPLPPSVALNEAAKAVPVPTVPLEKTSPSPIEKQATVAKEMVSDDESILSEIPAIKKAHSLNARAERFIRKRRPRKALRLLREAVLLDPALAPAYRNLGIAYALAGKSRSARKAYQHYLKLAPSAEDAPDVRRILGQ